MQKITLFLWFDNNAEEAVNLYISIFKNSKLKGVTQYDEAGSKASGRPIGSVMTVSFQLDGQDFVALNGGPHFKFTEVISFVVSCETQEEVDYFWEKLSEGEKAEMPMADRFWRDYFGSVTDKFGVQWMISYSLLKENQ